MSAKLPDQGPAAGGTQAPLKSRAIRRAFPKERHPVLERWGSEIEGRIADSMFDKSEDPIVIEAPKEVLQIRLQHPANQPAGDDLSKGPQSMMGAELWSAAERAGQEVLLVNSGQHLSRGALKRPVGDSWNPEGALLRLARLGDIDPPDVRRAISLAVDGLEHRLYPVLEALLRRLHRLTIHPGGGSLRNL